MIYLPAEIAAQLPLAVHPRLRVEVKSTIIRFPARSSRPRRAIT
ncbi:hypothetical protein [Pararhizobium sp. PWRC1-1]